MAGGTLAHFAEGHWRKDRLPTHYWAILMALAKQRSASMLKSGLEPLGWEDTNRKISLHII